MDNAEQSSRGPSKGIFDTASLLGPCGWWSATSPIVTTADFPGCGVAPIGDPFGRTGMCGRSPVSLGSSAHLQVPQPRRSIHGPQQIPCKTTALSPTHLQTGTFKYTSNTKSENDANPGKSSDQPKTTVNNVQATLSGSMPISVNSITKSPVKKILEISKEPNADICSLVPKNSSSRIKKSKNPRKIDTSRNGKRAKGTGRSRKQTDKNLKEKAHNRLSSDSEGYMESSCSSGVGDGAAGGVSSSGSSESSDEEEREKQQKELARLKKQQQELRRKVQELKQASHESSVQKADPHIKKTTSTPKSPISSSSVNHATKPNPSPAHSSCAPAVSPKTMSPKPKLSLCGEEDANMSVPLDLCMKKQEPTFEVTNSTGRSSYTSTSSAKRQLHMSSGVCQIGVKPQTVGPKKRGRKPKTLSINSNILQPDMAHQTKQNTVKELSNLIGAPHKVLLTAAADTSKNPAVVSQKKNGNTIIAPKAPSMLSSNACDPAPAPRKNFTLDSLLGESNGSIDIIPSLMENDMDMMAFSSKAARNRERLRYSSRIKKMEERSKEFETLTRPDSSSGTDSDPDNDMSDSDDTEQSASGNVSTSTGHGHKRSYDEDGEEFSNKRRRILPDEREVQIPLEHGWRRQTKIRCFSRSGVRGEVTYYTPCGKKLRNYPEVVRYLIKNGITDISRDNFTFSTKLNVGEFLESSSSGAGEDYVLLNEQDVVARINEVRARKGRLGVQNRKSAQQRSVEEEQQQRQWEQKQLQHQLEQQEMSRQAREMKMMRQLQREQALVATKDEKKTKAEEARRQKEQQRILKQQERFERLEQLRIEREIRAQQLLEEQEMKRQQAVFLREQERERRRQHMILVRALETRKKQEERERKREEMMYEKRINREKKLEQRRVELDYLRELKKPVEDMMLKNTSPLPVFNRISGMKLAGKAFADTLMVFEFLHNFGETLGFDLDSLPSLNAMQMALLNLDEKFEEELLSIIHHLLVCAIEDPGVPHCPEATTILGQNLKDADITNNNVSEVLRLYFIAHDKKSKMCQWLQAKPFLSLNATQKAEILAYVCNDLLCSRLLVRQIDSNIENVNVLRKDKWIVEGDLRRSKTAQQRRLLKARQTSYEETKLEQLHNGSTATTDLSNISLSKDNQTASSINDSGIKATSQCEKEKLDELDNDGNESGNDSEDTQAPAQVSDGEDEDLHLTNEELNKKVDKLTKQLNLYTNKLTRACHTIRAVTFGQDRYHRRYWVLPKSGGIFVESMESSELPKYQERILASSSDAPDLDKVKEATKSITLDTDFNIPFVKRESDTLIDKIVDKKFIGGVKEISELDIEIPNKKKTQVKESCDVKDSESESKSKDSKHVVKKEPDDITEVELDKEVMEKKETDNKVETDSKIESDSKIDATKNEKSSDNKESDPKIGIERKKSSDCEKESGNKRETESTDRTGEKKDEKKSNVNIFMPKFCDNSIGLDIGTPLNHAMHNSTERKHVPNPSIPNDQNWLLHSPFFASLLAGNMLFNGPMMPGREVNGTYFNLPKNDSNNPFGPFLGLQSGMLSAEQIFKSLNEKSNNQKPWFSILPRMPCDENSLANTQSSKNSGLPSLNSPANFFMPNAQSSSKSTSHSTHSSPASASAGHVASALSNFQMEMLNGMPPGFFLHPFLPHQFGPTYQSNLPATCTSHQTPFTPTLSHSSPMSDFTLNLGRPPASSTPSSIPTPSATPGPNSQGCATPTFRDSPSPSFTKRLMIEKMTQEYERPKPIPLDLQKGWWRMAESGHVKDMVNALHHRGIREKMLQKQLQKHFNYASTACSQGQNDDTIMEITPLDEEIAQLPGGAPGVDSVDEWSREIALRVDVSILEQVENLEEKVDGASMQVKGWKPPPKLSVESIAKFVPACEQFLQVKCSGDVKDSAKEKSPRKLSKKNAARKKRQDAKKKSMELDLSESLTDSKIDEADTMDKGDVPVSEILTDVTDEKVKLCDEMYEKEGYDIPVLSPGKFNPVEEAKKRLIMVEAAIERRYLRPPLGFSVNELNRSALSNSGANSNTSATESAEEEPLPVGLIKWRNAVQACRSSSQLAMCLNYLETFTAWDKSIMRASCQFCHSGDNEEMLLLCDGCDKGYHTYCFKPKMENIPDGDWYCYECLNKATGDNVCVICGKKGKLIECENCPKCFHLTCLEPPLGKMPKGKWYCSGCSQNRPKKTCKKNNNNNKDKEGAKEQKEASGNKKAESSQAPKPKTAEKKEKKEKVQPNLTNKDLAPCSAIVDEMEKHDDAWPFLSPVNTKQFPTYRKVIKKPMDLATVHGKLELCQYKCREDFAADVRLIFDNCETFNEDDSPVGQAGHTMRAFFETRWAEVCNT